jgi:hypothetical protein
MNKDGDLHIGIRVQMGQIQVIEIKETAEKKEKQEGQGRGEEKEHIRQIHGCPLLEK